MKRTIVLVVALAFVLLSAGAALAAITGSKHDMRTHLNVAGAAAQYDEVCVYCHTPHGANQALGQLWNRATPTATGFTPYTSTTMGVAPDQPGPGSMICLSCHDGSIAVDALANPPAGTQPLNGTSGALDASKYLIGNALIGKNLTDDHPIGFDYATAQGFDTAGLRLASDVTTSNVVRLINGNVECSSCHDAHNSAAFPFLRASNAGSALCLACHIK